MENDYVRCLENDIAVSQSPRPPVYVAPSYKEEFGIAILEAMSAGFLAIAPRRGGVKEYIKHGLNGFLIDTTSEETLGRDLVKILLDKDLSLRKMKMIAENGSRTVYRKYSISVVARMFADIYKSYQQSPDEKK
jgi:sucrose-phosphate synthase